MMSFAHSVENGSVAVNMVARQARKQLRSEMDDFIDDSPILGHATRHLFSHSMYQGYQSTEYPSSSLQS